jgi:hypothetical protein
LFVIDLMQISVSRTMHDMRLEGGPLVSPGLVMSGTLNILGIESDATVTLLPGEVSCMAVRRLSFRLFSLLYFILLKLY